VFARDGAVAPLLEYRRILRPEAWLWVDDCHGAGILGAKGRGSLELEGIDRSQVIQVITLSKAFGAHGGAVLADPSVIDAILARSDCHAGSTPPAIPIAAAARASVDFCRKDPTRRERLEDITSRFKSQLLQQGLLDELTPGPVFPIETTQSKAQGLRELLLANRIFPPWIQYPGGPQGGYFRFALCSEHSERVLNRLGNALQEWAHSVEKGGPTLKPTRQGRRG
jgi:7-keto-8-aminopelargonate synthetase-like enzyme